MLILKRKHKENPFEHHAQTDFWSERQDSNLRPDGPKPPALSTAPRPDVLIIPQTIYFCKWSNLWSNHFYREFCERAEYRKSQCLQGFSAFFTSGYLGGGVLLPNVARYQLRHTPKCENIEFLRFFRKWSNMWSNRFSQRF